jgi:hypothetical protein
MNEVKKALIEYFTYGIDGRRLRSKAPFGVSVSDAKLCFNVALTLTYRAGEKYCCTAEGCAFSPDWTRLRECLRSHGIEPEHPIRILLRCVFERGARFAVRPGDRNPVYEPLAQARVTEHVIDEIEGWSPAATSDKA